MAPSYRMPAEWEPHARTWLAWPHARADWPGKFAPVPWVFAEMIRHLAASERVGLLVKNHNAKKEAQDILEKAGANLDRVDFLTHPTNRGWLRDCGPIYVRDAQKKKVALDFQFNGWAKYANWRKDNTVAASVAACTKTKIIQPRWKNKRIVLEGGAIDVNGKGTLLTTEECLLAKTQCRNPGFTREDYESIFETYLGVEKTIWLGKGIAGDDTHGHVDDLARFVDETTVVTVGENNKKDANHTALEENFKRLKQARDAKGRLLTVIDLPMPRPVTFEGERLPASYANFLIANKIVLVPTFNDPNDRLALSILQEAFPRREVVGIHAVDLVLGLGTIHCLTQQEPA